MLVWKKKEKRIEISLFLWVWAERSLIVTERGAEDAERAEGVFRSAGERCAEGSGSRGKPHRQISSKSDLKWQSALLHNRHLSTITFFSFKLLLFFCRHSRASVYSMKWRKSRQIRCFSQCTEMASCPLTKHWSNRRGTVCLPGLVYCILLHNMNNL